MLIKCKTALDHFKNEAVADSNNKQNRDLSPTILLRYIVGGGDNQ